MSLLESHFKNIPGVKAWNFIKKDFGTGIFDFLQPYLQNISGWRLLLIPPLQPKFYPLITLCSFFLHFFLLLLIFAILWSWLTSHALHHILWAWVRYCSENKLLQKIIFTLVSRRTNPYHQILILYFNIHQQKTVVFIANIKQISNDNIYGVV